MSELLLNDYNNKKLDELKKDFSIFYMCDKEDPDYINKNNHAVKDHIDVVVRFYKKFACLIIRMMNRHPETDVICVMGP